MAGAYLGGSLVYKNQIGVNRAANAELPETFTRVARVDELADSQPKGAQFNDTPIVIVRRGASGENEFSVVAVHARTRGRGELVVPFGPQRIIGVSDQFEDDTVTPMYCLECDSNVWYRWNGRAYEPWLHNVGDTVLISSGEAGRRLTLFSDPRPDANRTADVSLCTKAEVLQVGGHEGQRWYRVEVDAPSSPRGWIPQQLVVEDVDCAR